MGADHIPPKATALWERQHHLKAKTAATEAATLLNQSASPDWLSACAAARSTLLRVRAIELREGRQSLFPTISHIFRRSGGSASVALAHCGPGVSDRRDARSMLKGCAGVDCFR